MKKILVIDNNRTIVEMLSAKLAGAGYRVMKAFDGMEALDILKVEQPDLIVLDLIMPKIDGYRLARYLKGDPQYRHIPIIILTGIAAEDSHTLFEVEADAFIAKGKIEDTFTHLLTTIKWLEGRKVPKREIIGAMNLYPREMTKELLLVKQHFDSMLHVMAEGVLEMDEHHRIFFANQAATRLLGMSEIDLFGKPITEVFPHSPDLREYMDKLPTTQRLSKQGIRLTLGGRIIRCLGTPFFFSQTYIGSIAVLEDITLSFKKEQALEELTTAIIENAPVGIGLLNGDLGIVLANDRLKVLAGDRGDVAGRSLLSLPNFSAEPFAHILRKAMAAGPPQTVSEEVSFLRQREAGGKTYHVTASQLLQQNGRPYLLVLVDDVTDKAELQNGIVAANRELERASQAKSNFLSIVSHELRTPLSVIRGYISLILDGKIAGATGEALEALQTSDKRARHLQQLIEELLDISRIEAGKITLKEDHIHLAKHIRETVDMFRADVAHRKLIVTVDLPGDLPDIVADHDKIHQIFTNLLSNAVKFTAAGGEIRISGERADGEVAVSVRDTGSGIPADKLRLIFDKFYQVDSTDTRMHGGAGLGLSIVRMILEAMKGRIEVESEMGRGSTFTVHLPIGAAETQAAQEAAKPPARKAAARGTGRRKRTILLCEDDDDTVKIIRYTLPGEEYDLLVATDGFDALQKIYTRAVDLILVDIRLPHMSGYDFCRILKANAATAGIPIIILSAAGQEEEIKKGFEAGAKEYIIKPFSPKDLLERIGTHIVG